MKLIVVFMFVLSFVCQAAALEVSNENYVEAKKNSQFIRFDLVAWKVGIFKSTFKNYVKNYKVTFQREGTRAKNVEIVFKVSDMDTDIEGRNEKMWNFCLSMAEFPEIRVVLTTDIELNRSEEQIVPAKIKIRGKEYPLDLYIKSEKKGDEYHLVGKSTASLKALSIPDPSIAVASLEDTVQIYFELQGQ